MTIDGYTNTSKPAKSICERARKVDFRGESPSEEYMGFIEVISGQTGTFEIHLERSALKKYRKNAKWHTQSVYAIISPADFAHLMGTK